MNKLRFSLLSDVIRLLRGTELQPAASSLSIWLTHRLSSGPGFWDLLCEGLGHSEYLPGNLPVVTGAPDLSICFPGGVVDPVEWDWAWVPRGLHLKCRNRFFFFFFCEKNIRLNTEGVLTKRTGGCSEHWVISTVIWAIRILFFYFHVWKVSSPNERELLPGWNWECCREWWRSCWHLFYI